MSITPENIANKAKDLHSATKHTQPFPTTKRHRTQLSKESKPEFGSYPYVLTLHHTIVKKLLKSRTNLFRIKCQLASKIDWFLIGMRMDRVGYRYCPPIIRFIKKKFTYFPFIYPSSDTCLKNNHKIF